MTAYRHNLPQASGETLLTDGGLETTLIFDNGFDLPQFASFPLVESEEGRAALVAYYHSYVEVARAHQMSIVLDTPTWRASSDWGAILGYDADALRAVNHAAVELLMDVRAASQTADTKIVISGNLGPRGDGYDPGEQMSADEAASFHLPQIRALTDAGADVITALTMTYLDEAIGVARAASTVSMPVVVSFTVETDGRLPTGQPLDEAIGAVDADTGGYPMAFGINCAHPDHFMPTVRQSGDWVNRIGLVRSNASRMSHEELDNADELDAGDRAELAGRYADLQLLLPNLKVMGGCCGTDHGHIDAIGTAIRHRIVHGAS